MKGVLRPRLALAACLLALVTPFARLTVSMEPAQQQAPVFRSRIDLVELDASVLDKDRRPVRGLTKADFTVFEDGKPQEIAVFEAINVPDPEPSPVEWMRDVTPDVTTNEVRPTRLWVVAIDDALIPSEPWTIQATKKIVRDIVDKFGPEDLVAIVYTADSRQAQDFTNDHTRLLVTLEKFHGGLALWRELGSGFPRPGRIPPPKPAQDPQFWIGSVLTTRNIMEALSAMPNRRKAMIWITPGAPMNVFGTDDVNLRLKDLTQEIFALARRANVPIYPIDPSGLFGLKAFVTNGNMAWPDEPEMPWVLAMDHIMMNAANTGGRAVVNTNDFTTGINNIFLENSSYYSLGFYSTNTKTDGTIRRLEVKVNRRDVTVRTRDTYIAPGAKDAPPKSTNDVLARATASSVPIRELPLRATVAPFAIPGGRNAAVAIALGVTQPVPDSASKGRATVTTELRTTAFTTEGDNKGSQRHTAKVTLRAGAQGDADYEALSRIDLPPGRYRLRLAAYLVDAGKTGTVMVDVVVPDFNHDKVSMSGVVIGATPGRPSAPRELFTNILPLVPSAQRAFARTDRASALFYLYQSTTTLAPAAVAIRVTDGRGAVVINDTQTAGVDRFMTAEANPIGSTRPAVAPVTSRADPFANRALRAAEFQYPLPIDRLPPGRYLLTFEATIGATTMRRDVQFTVK